MTFAYWMILAAACLPYLTIGAVKASSRDYDNHAPREWLARQTGWRRRGAAAERNHFEFFPLFAAAVLLAGGRGAPALESNVLAGAFVVLRLGYTAAYIGDRPTLRSLSWIAAFCCVLGLFYLGLLTR